MKPFKYDDQSDLHSFNERERDKERDIREEFCRKISEGEWRGERKRGKSLN